MLAKSITGFDVMRMFGLVSALLVALSLQVVGLAQPVWEVNHRDREILIDGFIDEWDGVSDIIFAPGAEGIRSGGEFVEGDVELRLQSLWDEEYLYFAISWKDNTWDIQQVSRKDAVWVDSNNRRRDRMYFYDNLKFQIRTSNYDYTLWVSPRVNEEGPFLWARLLEGYKGMERATSTPVVSARELEDRVTMEILILWNQLRLEPKKNEEFPLTLLLTDGDHPGRLLDYKLDFLKWLGWVGKLRIVE